MRSKQGEMRENKEVNREKWGNKLVNREKWGKMRSKQGEIWKNKEVIREKWGKIGILNVLNRSEKEVLGRKYV